MTERLDPDRHEWMTHPAVAAVVAALDAGKPAGVSGPAARFVGGCVRNALLGAPVDDVDVATPLTPQEAIDALEAAGLRAVPTGVAHGTVTAVADGYPVEVTTLRRDVETDGRRAVVAYTHDWVEDSERRDFRLNAIYADPDGTLFDPQGGVADAAARRIVFIGSAEERIREDYLRILRFFRFRAWYGTGEADAEAMAACAALVKGMRGLSVERVWKELKKLLGAPDPAVALRDMAATGVLEQVLPEAIALDLTGALVEAERREGWRPDALLRLAALIPRMELVVARVRRRLKLSNAEGERLQAWAGLKLNPRVLVGRPEAEIAAAFYALDRTAVLDRARLGWAIDRAQGETPDADWRAFIRFAETWERPIFPVSGDDVVAAGVPKGPPVGAALKALEALWIKGGFKATREQLLAALPMVRI